MGAHMTGFASINAWGTLQQFPWFSQTWYTALLALPAALCFQIFLQLITDKIRTMIALGDDGSMDKCEELWDEECEEAENDIMGLSLSFLLVQSFRFFVNGDLANVEGKETEA